MVCWLFHCKVPWNLLLSERVIDVGAQATREEIVNNLSFKDWIHRRVCCSDAWHFQVYLLGSWIVEWNL